MTRKANRIESRPLRPPFRQPPSFWWDFEWKNGEIAYVLVESDDDRLPIVGRIRIAGQNAEREIDQAEALIADLIAGRADPRRLAATVQA